MADIREFTIENLAGRGDSLHYKLNRDVNVFFGPNGCGKTCLLRLLDSAMANDASLVVNVPFDAARVIIHSDRYDKDFAYTLSRGHDIIPLAEAEEEPGAAELESGRLRHLRSPKWKVSPDLPPHLSKWQHRYLSTFRLIMLGDVRRAPYHYFVPEEPLPPMDDAINASFGAQLQRY